MQKRQFTIINRLGLHARAAALLVKTASRFSSEVTLHKEDVEVNGKSIMGILLLAAPKGSELMVVTDGTDEEQAMQEIGKLIEDGFGEE
ncbi:MAG: HPr family phosphocarrier protein [Pelovirga sp.]